MIFSSFAAVSPRSLNRALSAAPFVVISAIACSSEPTPPDMDANPIGASGSGSGQAGSGAGAAGAVTAEAGAGGAPLAEAPSAGGGGMGGAASPTIGAGAGAGGASADAGAAGEAGAGGAAADPACGAAMFCEDFERFEDGASPQDARWTSAETLESFTVDSMRPAHGDRALHVNYVADGKHRWIRTTEPFPALAVQHYGRLRVFMDNIPDPNEYRHWVTVAVGGTDSPNIVKVVGGERTNGLDHYVAQIDIDLKDQVSDDLNSNTIGEDRRHEDNVALQKGVWQCYEWFYDSVKNSYRLWLDGNEMPGAAWDPENDPGIPDNYDFPEVTQVFLTWWEYHPQGVTWDVYLDDFALHDQRIGCD